MKKIPCFNFKQIYQRRRNILKCSAAKANKWAEGLSKQTLQITVITGAKLKRNEHLYNDKDEWKACDDTTNTRNM